MSDESAFLAQILSNPADDAPRLVYADWLEERGDPVSLAKGRFLRLECEIARPGLKRGRRKALRKQLAELARPLDTAWLAVVSKLPIENCNVEFEFQCPKRWEGLRATGEPAVRFCETCRKNVHYCETIQEARLHAENDECVAVDCAIPRQPGDLEIGLRGMKLGRVSPDYFRQLEERRRPDEVSEERERCKRGEG